ncbi:MAG: hypothetical protein Aurels2KO_47350 [Aureliella sp.]
MNNDYSDQILESMLEESLGGKTPPDLSDRILAAWQKEKVTGQQQQSSSVETDAPLAANSKPAPTQKPIVAEVVRPAQAPTTRPAAASSHKSVSAPERSINWRAMLATSAVAALLLTGWALRDQFLGSSSSQQASTSPDALGSTGDADGRPTPEPAVAADPAVSLAGSPAKNSVDPVDNPPRRTGAQALPLDDLPFGPSAASNVPAKQLATSDDDVKPLSDEVIVSTINNYLDNMWTQSGIKPTEELPQSEWIEKASQRLLGSKDVNLAASTATRSDAVRQFVSSPGFAKTWSEKLAAAWLEQSPGQFNKDAATEIRSAIQSRLRAGTNFGAVATDLLGGDLTAKGPSQAFVGSLAGGGNHSLLRRIGTHFLGANLGCVQCHDRGAESSELAAPALDQQEGYWSLIAMLRGVDIRVDDSGRRVPVDKQVELFNRKRQHNEFFELPDGRMKAAVARLPDGKQWSPGNETPRQALAQWISQSQEFDLAIANQAWKLATGEAIVYDASYPDFAALESRQQLLQLLAQQYRANGRSVQKLATWIVFSEAFDRKPLELNAEQLLVASESDLEHAKLMRRLFAADNATEKSLPVERNLMLAANFRRPTTGDEITLAQPSATAVVPKQRPKPKQSKEPSPEQLDFTLGADHVSFANAQYIDSLLETKRLTWEQRVGHVVLLDSHARVSDRVKQLANTLLQHHNGDSRAALLDLLWAVKRSL